MNASSFQATKWPAWTRLTYLAQQWGLHPSLSLWKVTLHLWASVSLWHHGACSLSLVLPRSKDWMPCDAPSMHTVAAEKVLAAQAEWWRVTLWLSCLVHFFWVWNEITEVESGIRKLEEPSNGRAFDSCFFPALWEWQNADKIQELDEMKQSIRVPCHLGRWWLKTASLTGSPGVLSRVMLKVIVQRGLGWLLGQLRTSRAARECLWKQDSPSSH